MQKMFESVPNLITALIISIAMSICYVTDMLSLIHI